MFSVATLAGAALETAYISVPTILDGLLGRIDPRACDRRLDRWSRRLLDRARVEVLVSGRGHIVPGENYVVMSNHQSHYDIPVLYQALGLPLRMVAKRELFEIPVMGAAMRYSGFIEVDRGRHKQAVESLNRARTRIAADKTSVWIAPEGTRSRDGKLGPFKRGGFVLALETGLRILPVTLVGSRDVLRVREARVNRGKRVRVVVSEPLDPASYGRSGISSLVRHVHAGILGSLEGGAS